LRAIFYIRLLAVIAVFFCSPFSQAQQPAPAPSSAGSGASIVPFKLNVGLEAAKDPKDVDSAIKILFAITLLTLAPSIILLMTSFTRIVIVLSFVRSALALQGLRPTRF
jgi:flagellar biosynthetic protein FliP